MDIVFIGLILFALLAFTIGGICASEGYNNGFAQGITEGIQDEKNAIKEILKKNEGDIIKEIAREVGYDQPHG